MKYLNFSFLLFFLQVPVLRCQQPAPSQTKNNPSAAQRKIKNEFRFSCPDPLATAACKSFLELYKAGDEAVKPTYEDSMAYACFRQKTDEFFVIELLNPRFSQTHTDTLSGKEVPDSDATARGHGHINAFINGIQDNSNMPISLFVGDWTYIFEPEFAATTINFLKSLPDTEHYGVSANSSQFNAMFRYKNRADKEVDYSLVIQRSTGRFSEQYTEDKAQFPFLENNGYCSRLPLRGEKARE